MSHNSIGQSKCKIFKSNKSLKQNEDIALFFSCWYKFMGIRSWLKILGVKNECGHSGHRALRLATLGEGINEMNWFFTCWNKFRKSKS